MDKKINLLFLVSRFDIGGVEKKNVSMVNGVDKEKFNVHVLYIKEGEFLNDVKKDLITIHKIGNTFKLKSFTTFVYIYKVIRYIKNNNIDIVHSIDAMFYFIGSIAAHFTRISHVRTQPSFIRRHEKLNYKTLKYLPFERWTNKFITYNYATGKDLELAGVAPEKIEVIHGFAKHKDYLEYSKSLTDIRLEFNIPKNNKIILALHRMVPRKGYETFIEMIPHVINEYSEVSFLLVGDGILRNDLEEKVKEMGIEDYVRFAGFRTDVVNIIKQIDFGVYPIGDTAGMSGVIRSGKVLISKRNSAMDEYIVDNSTGFLVPDNQPETYAKYALKLLKDEELLEKMEKNQREFVLSTFNGEENMKRFENILIQTCKKKRNTMKT